MASKPCVACHKQIAVAFQKCSFCGAAQPLATPEAAPKESRCETCKRPYAAKLTECPFCARDRAAGVKPAAFGAGPPSSGRSIAAPDDEPADQDGPRTWSSAALIGVPILLGAIWGISRILYALPLDDSSGTARPSVIVALFVAPLLAVLFVRRSHRTLEAALEELGLSRVLIYGFAAAALTFVPVALSAAGFIYWYNGFGIEDRAQVVVCKAGSVWHQTRKGTDMGWTVSYSCDVEGEHFTGSVGGLEPRPNIAEGGPVHFRAGRGRFGYWMRLSEPLPPNVTATPPP